ncbi:MAG: valine--tRNA ligase [Spirochaetia bacterium]
MKTIALDKAYNPKEFEDRIYRFWQEKEAFTPRNDGEQSFVIVIPPPNVTGVLHMGHGLNNSLQDILIRFHRMKGKAALWLPGTDHAGIATQNVVERRLLKQGLRKEDLGRERFIQETWRVKEEHQNIIIRQLKKIGSSCDWNRERFTLDEGLSAAVREVFVSLYERGLIYRGNYLVNWCPSCGTALSDDEVEHSEVRGFMYRFRYPLEDGSGSLRIATTRPETMLGDTAVAVHPEDERYSSIVGKKLVLPLTGRLIPVIADEYVDRGFGTGAVKVTPAHDPNDWEMGRRHQLESINILSPDGTLNSSVPDPYRGLTVKEARKAVVRDLEEQGFFAGTEDHMHQVGHCYRCDSVVEPYLSDQWFVRMKPLAEKALQVWEKGGVTFYPKKWENTYTHWLKGIRDWCISRQLWWGHRIPVWYCDECGEIIVSRSDPDACSSCGSVNIRQDEDVLDTWFSSWLWPFSTLGWPEKTDDLSRFYPTSTLVTAYDIIFFWVARMIMAGMEFMDQPPFSDIYITGLIRDIQGRKMSKSLGNGMDPLEIVDEYGADALKFTLAFMAAQGQDILIEKDTFKIGSKFANKIWNAARYLLMNLTGRNMIPAERIEKKPIDLWIYHRLNTAAKNVENALLSYRFNDASQAVYEYFWNDFCDWYIEASKLSLYSDNQSEKDRAVSLLLLLLEESLRLLHPFLPFLTEEIYQKLPDELERGKYGDVIRAPYPEAVPERENPEIAASFETLQEAVGLVRTLRSELTIPPEKRIDIIILGEEGFPSLDFIKDHASLMRNLTGAGELEFSAEKPSGVKGIGLVGTGFEIRIQLKDSVDIPKLMAKIKKDIDKTGKLLNGTERKLANKSFTENAPPVVVQKEIGKKEEFQRKISKMTGYLKDLSG